MRAPRWLLVVAMASASSSIASSTTESGADETDEQASAWIEGPAAPPSNAPLPPAVAPRDGVDGQAPQEVLVVPDRPAEDRRRDRDDGLLDDNVDLRAQTSLSRQSLTSSSSLDLDSALAGLAIPGLVWLTSSSGASRPVARGHQPGQLAIVVDGVPLLTDAFGVSVAPSEVLSPVGVARWTMSFGPRAFSPSSSSQAGLLTIDTGGPLTDLGESHRADGLLAGGSGGADVESGATALLRTGWRTLRVMGHGTVLHRQDQRPGRFSLGLPTSTTPPPSSTALVENSGGTGGMVGARVDVVPLEKSRFFISYLAGRSLDVPDPRVCGRSDDEGRTLDCIRAIERGVDVGIVGFDVRRDVGAFSLQPTARVHLQRALSFDERSGRERSSVDLAKDEVTRGGASIGVVVRGREPWVWDLRPAFDVFIDAFADRASSQFFVRSLRRRDAVPDGDGEPFPLRARARPDAVAHQGLVRTQLRLDGALWSASISTRLQALSVTAPAVVDDDGRRNAVDVATLAPSVDAAVRVALTPSWQSFVAVGAVDRGDDPAAVVAGPGHGQVRRGSSLGDTRGSERFAEVGISGTSNAIDTDVVVFTSLRTPAPTVVAAVQVAGPDQGVAGVEGRFRLKPDVSGLLISGSLAGVVVDEDFFGTRGPAANVMQPQGQLQIDYAPSSSPFRVFARSYGALPQTRLSTRELDDPQLCPERTEQTQAPADRPCSGVPGFLNVDVGAAVQLGQLRVDVTGENVLDQRNVWRGAAMGAGGAAVRARITFVW